MRRSSSAFSILTSISSISNGFWTKSKAPLFIASTAVVTEPNAVIRMTEVDGWSAFAVRRTSRPSLPPIFRSLSTTSKYASCSRAIAALPFGASSVSWPASVRARASPRRSAS